MRASCCNNKGIIRSFERNDLKEYLNLVDEFSHSDAVLHPWPEQYSINTFNEVLKENSSVDGYIFEYDGVVCGYSVITKFYQTEVGGNAAQIEEVYLKSEVRSKGFGKDFFNFVFEKYKDLKRLRLEVDIENFRAIEFYKRNGFEFLNYLQMVKEK